MRIATGFLDPDAGEVDDRRHRDGDRSAPRAQARLGYLPEQAPAPVELTVRDHLRLRARLKGIKADAVAAAVDRSLEAAAIDGGGGPPDRHAVEGLRQRVGLADALLGDPPLLVLDEPTSGMDPIQTRQLRDHLIARGQGARGAGLEPRGRRSRAARGAGGRAARGRAGRGRARPPRCARRPKTTRLEAAVVALLDEPPARAAAGR